MKLPSVKNTTINMTRFHLTKYFVQEACVNIARNKLLNGITIGMIAVSLSIFGIFWLLYNNLDAVAKRWTDTLHIIVYLVDNLSEQQRKQLGERIRGIEYVENAKYISPEDALQQFKKRLGAYASLLEGLESNPLPASYEIQLDKKHRDLPSVQKVVLALQRMHQLEDIQYSQMENLTLVMNLIKFIAAFLGIFLFLTVIFIISNTIRLTLYSREEELSILKFIGATESFIKGPFLAEGIIRGLLGAAVSLGLLYLIYRLFLAIMTHSAQSLLIFSAIDFLSKPAMIGMILLGTFLGWCGSLLTLHKYLKNW
jgi:cell division transport system permease protein